MKDNEYEKLKKEHLDEIPEGMFGTGSQRVLVDRFGELILCIESEQVLLKVWIPDSEINHFINALIQAAAYRERVERARSVWEES